MKKLIQVLVFIVSFTGIISPTIAQNSKLVTTVQAGYWNDPSIWNTGKIPDSGDVVLLNHDLIVNRDVKCFAFYTNGYALRVLPGNTIDIIGKNENVDADSIQILSFASTSTNETLQVVYIKNGLEYLLYGTKDALGNLNKLTRAQYRKVNSNDTVMNLIYDDSVRVKAMYATINGVNDSSFFKFTYTDSLLITTRCKIDWQNETYIVRDIFPSKRSANNYAPFGIVQNGDGILPIIAGGIAAIGVGAIIVTFGSAAVGAAVGYYLVSTTASAAINGAAIGGIAGAMLFLNSVKASTIQNYPKPIPPSINPAFNTLILNNPTLIDSVWFGQNLPLLATYQKKITAPTRVLIQANVLSDGGSPILNRGLCFRADTLAAPTIADGKIQVVAGVSPFNIESDDLEANKTYSFRPFASNKNGISYGAIIKHRIGGDTVQMLIDHGIWDAIFFGAGPNGQNELGVLHQVKENGQCPNLVSAEYRDDKARFLFSGNFTGTWGFLSYSSYAAAISYDHCTANYESEYYWTNYASTWEYIHETRTIRKRITIDDVEEIYEFVITNISDKELSGYYSSLSEGAIGFFILR
jgi:hypothetical protein